MAALLAAAMLLASSCAQLTARAQLDDMLESRNAAQGAKLEREKRERALRDEVMRRFALIRKLISNRKFSQAEEVLATMSSLTEYQKELDDMKRLISLSREMGGQETALDIDQRRALNEVSERLKLPYTYATSVSITPDLEDFQPPQGPIEKLLSQKVTMKVSNMQLADLAMKLREIDDVNFADPLNIIFSDDVVKDKTFSCNFKDVPLHEVFSYISRNLGVAFNITESLIWVTVAPKASNGLKLETRVLHLRYGSIPKVPEGIGVSGKTAFTSGADEDKDLVTALEAFFKDSPTGGSFNYFPNRNLLILKDTRENLREVISLVEELDRPPYQVVIEARFLTVSESDLYDVGVELTRGKGGQAAANLDTAQEGRANISDFFTQLGALKTGNAEGVGSLTVSGILGHRSFDMLISAIQNKSSAVTLSAPRLTVLNNRTGRIRKGDKRYYFEEYGLQTVNRGDQGNDQILVPKGKPTSVQLGITFDATVSVGHDAQNILLGLKPEIIEFIDWEDYAATQTTTDGKTTTTYNSSVLLPRIHEQGISTSVSIRSGETVILGGMVENLKKTGVKQSPILGDIPLIGAFFRHTEERMTPTNLLIFVTATIMNDKGEYVVYTPELTLSADDLTPLSPLEDEEPVDLSDAPSVEVNFDKAAAPEEKK